MNEHQDRAQANFELVKNRPSDDKPYPQVERRADQPVLGPQFPCTGEHRTENVSQSGDPMPSNAGGTSGGFLAGGGSN